MEFITSISDLSEIIKKYLKTNNVLAKNFAGLLNMNPSYLSRILNKNDNISAETMLKVLHFMGYELVAMTKKERNLYEQGAFAELYKDSKSYREQIQKEMMAEIQEAIAKNLKAIIEAETKKTNNDK